MFVSHPSIEVYLLHNYSPSVDLGEDMSIDVHFDILINYGHKSGGSRLICPCHAK